MESILYDLILHVYKDTFDKEHTVLIATYALRHSGLNVTVASVEDTFNQMIQGSFTIGNECRGSFYSKIIKLLNVARDNGHGQDIIDLIYMDFINLRSICYD